jgi:hypothetical protein
MGYPYDKLIAPAVLHMNPGITREQFAELLDSTHSNNTKAYEDAGVPWDVIDESGENQDYHNGLEGLARFLNLYETLEYTNSSLSRTEIPLLMEDEKICQDELFVRYPLLHLGRKYNWAQEKGYFRGTGLAYNFVWKMQSGRYYLDDETFDRIPVSFRLTGQSEYGYTDLILTEEAIRQRAWKLMTREGRQHRDDFLRDFPDSLAARERSVWDAFTSLYAKSHGMTNTELMRMRLLARVHE